MRSGTTCFSELGAKISSSKSSLEGDLVSSISSKEAEFGS